MSRRYGVQLSHIWRRSGITGMYENPLLQKHQRPYKGKGPRNYSRLDERIYDDICERLTRHPLIDASFVEVQVLNGEATLTGEVLDRRMKNMIEDVLDEVSGVKEINNNLRVNRDHAA